MPRRLKPVAHDERLSLVDHLDELRSRLIYSLFAFLVALALCFWQNHYILELLNAPLGRKPVTLAVGEQFTTTFMVSAYSAILLALPVLLFQVYSFVLPAFSPGERKVALPLLLMVPFLFIAGVVFGYYVVLPQAIAFLLNFNADEFSTLVRARDYYGFASMSLIAIGILFQIPVVVLAVTRLGIVTPAQLRRNRRYAILAIAVVAMLLPGQDPVTMVISMVPLYLLFEFSILLAVAFGGSPSEAGVASAEGS